MNGKALDLMLSERKGAETTIDKLNGSIQELAAEVILEVLESKEGPQTFNSLYHVIKDKYNFRAMDIALAFRSLRHHNIIQEDGYETFYSPVLDTEVKTTKIKLNESHSSY